MRHPMVSPDIFKERRKQLSQKIPGAAVVIFAAPEVLRNHDSPHPHRQDTNLFYLTGFEEPGSCLLFRPGMTPETVVFVREKNPERETWDGFRFGTQAAKQEFGFDETYRIEEFSTIAPRLLMESEYVVYSLYQYEEADEIMRSVLKEVRALKGRSGMGILPIQDSYKIIGEMRIIKSDYEIEMMKKASEIAGAAHLSVMKTIRPGMNERELHGLYTYETMKRGVQRDAYSSIVAAGPNATTLHYVFNDQACRDGDMLLIDAGAEWKYYHADITRTYPINGRFSPIQKDLYQAMLTVQLQMLELVRPGIALAELQQICVRKLTELMLHFGLLRGSVDEQIEKLTYKKYYPHGVSHFLGSETHDSGLYFVNGKPRPLAERMVITVEPGIYIPADDTTAPENFRGIGIRIEDNVLLTATGNENLTHVPKTVAELESLIGKA